MRPLGLAVPAGDAGEPVRDIADFDIERRRIEQVEPTAGQGTPASFVRGPASPVGAGHDGSPQVQYHCRPWPPELDEPPPELDELPPALDVGPSAEA